MSDNPNVKAVLSNSLPLLQITFDSETVKEPGQFLSRSAATPTPKVAYKATSGTYLLLNVDLDAPFKSLPFLGPILHWLEPSLTLSSSPQEEGFATLTKDEGSKLSSVFWAPPGPPPGAAPHRYVFLLYEQPDGFDPAKLGFGEGIGRRARMRFDLNGFEEKAGLGKAVAGNWFESN